jgi:hypothetical protein
MPLPSGPLTVTTKPQQWGDAFGEIGSVAWPAPPSLIAFEAVLGILDPSALLGLGSIDKSTSIGIGLGNDPTLQATGAPLNAAIPYLYLSVNPAANTAVSVSAATQASSVIIDPADPFIYIGSPQTGSKFPITAVAVSQSGLIPYAPDDAPSPWNGSLRGHLYIQGVINTTDLTVVPSELEGSVTLNLDPNHTGQWLGGSITPLQMANLLVAGTDPVSFLGDGSAVDQLFKNFIAGLNGELKISPWDKVADIPGLMNRLGGDANHLSDVLKSDVPRALTVGHASLIYDGPTESCYFRGGTTSPFEGTVAAPFAAPVSLDVDAALKPGGEFYLDAKGTYYALGLTAGGEVKVLNNWPTQVHKIIGPGLPFGTQTIYVTEVDVDLNVSVPIVGSVDIHGKLQGNGDFDLSGSAALDIPGLKGSANFDLKYLHTGNWTFTDVASPHYDDNVVRADLNLAIYINVDPYGDLTFSGSGTASSFYVNTWIGWVQVPGSVGVGIINHEIWFEADGHEVDIYF